MKISRPNIIIVFDDKQTETRSFNSSDMSHTPHSTFARYFHIYMVYISLRVCLIIITRNYIYLTASCGDLWVALIWPCVCFAESFWEGVVSKSSFRTFMLHIVVVSFSAQLHCRMCFWAWRLLEASCWKCFIYELVWICEATEVQQQIKFNMQTENMFGGKWLWIYTHFSRLFTQLWMKWML